jgi:tetratricopeptide (TPR) repeat protein
VIKLSDQFPIEKTAGAMRAFSATLSTWGLPEDAIRYATQGLDLLEPGNSALRFYLTRTLSLSNASLEKYAEAVSAIDDAIAVLPEDWKNDPDLLIMAEEVYTEKAQYLQAIDKPDEAVEAFNASRSVNPKAALNGYKLDDITRVWSHIRDPKGVKLLSLVQGWNEKERNSWFEYMFQWNDTYAVLRLSHIAGFGGAEEKRFILDCYDRYMESASRQKHTDRLVLCQVALADLYRTVLNDDAKAQQLYSMVMKTDLRDYDTSGLLDEKLSDVRRELADIIFTEFRTSKDPQRKIELLQEIKDLPIKGASGKEVVDLMESNVSVMIGSMQKAMGPTTEYQAITQKIFDACIAGLSDSVGWNDLNCFRLLAKVLAPIKGLERDALIALSCQFSRVTEPSPSEDSDSDEPVDEISSSVEGSAASLETDNTSQATIGSGQAEDNLQLEVKGTGSEQNETNMESK